MECNRSKVRYQVRAVQSDVLFTNGFLAIDPDKS